MLGCCKLVFMAVTCCFILFRTKPKWLQIPPVRMCTNEAHRVCKSAYVISTGRRRGSHTRRSVKFWGNCFQSHWCCYVLTCSGLHVHPISRLVTSICGFISKLISRNIKKMIMNLRLHTIRQEILGITLEMNRRMMQNFTNQLQMYIAIRGHHLDGIIFKTNFN